MEHPRVTDAPSPDFCPYVGLRPFTIAEQAFFFGRRSETRVVAANLFASPLTVFYGPSAVGKSSVLQAGVIPQLRREPKTAVLYFRDWQHDDYVERLKTECRLAIVRALGAPLEIDNSLPFEQWIDGALEQFRGQLHILLDQFEEYLLYHPDSSLTAFDGELAAAVNRRDIGARFLIGLREDGLAKLDRFRKRIPNLLGNTLRLRRLSLDSAREAIEGPLRVYNEQRKASGGEATSHVPVVIESELVDAILDQVRSDHVTTGASAGEGSVKGGQAAEEVETAYLQLVMERLWRERTAVNGHLVIQRARLDALGGAKAIAKSHFDEHLDRLMHQSPQVDDMVCDLFVHLVTPSGSKISQKEDDLLALTAVPAEQVRWFLQELVASRLLRVTDPPERYEIFHDALAKAFLGARRAIVLKRSAAAREAELKRVQAVADAQQARADAEARRVTEQRAATRRFKWLAVGALALAVAAAISALFAWSSMNEARRARLQAEALRGQAQAAETQIADITKRTTSLATDQQRRIDELIAKLTQSETLSTAERQKLLEQSEGSKAELNRLSQQYEQVQRSSDASSTAQRDLANTRALVVALEAKLRTSQDDFGKLTSERDQWRDDFNKASASLKTSEGELRTAQSALKTAQGDLTTARAELKAAQAEIDRLRTDVEDLNKKLAALSGRAGDPGALPPIPTAVYQRALDAFERRQWGNAATLFAQAAGQRGDADETLRLYGMRSEKYLPNYYLGRAYRELGRCDDALRAWAQSEKDGIVQTDSAAYKTLQQGRAACQAKD